MLASSLLRTSARVVAPRAVALSTRAALAADAAKTEDDFMMSAEHRKLISAMEAAGLDYKSVTRTQWNDFFQANPSMHESYRELANQWEGASRVAAAVFRARAGCTVNCHGTRLCRAAGALPSPLTRRTPSLRPTISLAVFNLARACRKTTKTVASTTRLAIRAPRPPCPAYTALAAAPNAPMHAQTRWCRLRTRSTP